MTEPVVSIRPVEDDDLPILYEHQADPIANAMAVVPAKDRPAFDAHWVKIRANETGVARTAVRFGMPVALPPAGEYPVRIEWPDGSPAWPAGAIVGTDGGLTLATIPFQVPARVVFEG